MPEDNETLFETPLPEPTATIDQDRYARAAKVVDRFVLWSGAAGLIPVPVLDITVVAGVQLQMLRRVAEIYDVKFSANLGKSVLASLTGSMVATTSGLGVASVVKGLPVLGTTVAALSMPALSAGATYIVGRVFIQHFAHGGTLLDFNPPDYREFIKEQTDKLKEQKDKLKAKLDAPSGSKSTSAAGGTAADKQQASSST